MKISSQTNPIRVKKLKYFLWRATVSLTGNSDSLSTLVGKKNFRYCSMGLITRQHKNYYRIFFSRILEAYFQLMKITYVLVNRFDQNKKSKLMF